MRNILYPRNTPKENVCTYDVPTKKSFGPTKCLRKKFWTHEILTRKTFAPISYPQMHNISRPTRPTIARDPRNLAHS